MKRSLTSPEPEARSHKTARLDAKGVPSAHPTLAYPSHLPPPTTPAFAQPAPLLTFSYDEAHVQHFDDRALRKLRPAPPIDADLNHGYERWTRRAEARPRLDGLLRALEKAPGVTPGVSTWRGVMTR
jgi:RAT1-interacting protein